MGGPKTQLKVTKITMHHQAPPTTLGKQRRCPCAACQLCDVKENLCREFAAYFWFHLHRGERREKRSRQSRWCCQDS